MKRACGWVKVVDKPHYCERPKFWFRKRAKSTGSQWRCKCGRLWEIEEVYNYSYGWVVVYE